MAKKLESKVKERIKEAKDLGFYLRGKELVKAHARPEESYLGNNTIYFGDIAIQHQTNYEWVKGKAIDRLVIYLSGQGYRNVFEQIGNKITKYIPGDWFEDFYEFYSSTFPKKTKTAKDCEALSRFDFKKRFGL